MPIDMASRPIEFSANMPALNHLGPSAGFDVEGRGNTRIPVEGYSMNQNPPEAALQQHNSDISAPMLSQAPPVSNEMEMSRFRNLEQQQAQNFAARLMLQEEIARRGQSGQDSDHVEL